MIRLTFDDDAMDCDGLAGHLTAHESGWSLLHGRYAMDRLDDFHSLNHPSECCKAACIGRPATTRVEGRLIADADEETLRGGQRLICAGQGYHPILVTQATLIGRFKGDIDALLDSRLCPGLDHLDGRLAPVIVGPNNPAERAAVETRFFHFGEESGDSAGGAVGPQLDYDIAQIGNDAKERHRCRLGHYDASSSCDTCWSSPTKGRSEIQKQTMAPIQHGTATNVIANVSIRGSVPR